MSATKRAFLDYYGKHKISPVSQDVTDMQAHYARRDALYRHLGIVSSLLRGRSVIEFGPGSGHNALFTGSLKPSRYVLVDANPTGLENTRKNLKANGINAEVVESDIFTFDTDERFDLVLCEGVLPWQNNPTGMLRQVARFVAPGGVLVITCSDAVSSLSEILRRLQAMLLVDPKLPFKERVQKLVPIFEADLKSLKGMTRPAEDWIMDSITQPLIGSLLSIEEAIITLQNEFDAYAASPDFLTDWTWYKEVPLREQTDNELHIKNFLANIHNFLDYRVTSPARDVQANRKIEQLCVNITKDQLDYEQVPSDALFDKLLSEVSELTGLVSEFADITGAGLADFTQGMLAYKETGKFPLLPTFAPLFGRGQQYLSFIRR